MSFTQNIAMTKRIATTGRIVRRTTDLDAPAEVIWAAAQTPQAFRYVTRGLLDWRPLRGQTDPWRQGDEATGWLLLFGVVPFSKHRIRVAEIDPATRTLRSEESGGAIRSWCHDIVVEEIDADRCRYTDEIRLDAGPLTLAVTAFAWVFYGERQRRWRRLAPALAGAERVRADTASAT